MSLPEKREHLVTLRHATMQNLSTGEMVEIPLTVEPQKRLRRRETPTGISLSVEVPFSSGEFEEIEQRTEITLTGIRKNPELTIMERLRADHPDENIVSLGAALKHPSEMSAFYFQYAEELKTSSRLEVVRQHPYDTAKGHITRMANHIDRETVGRWQEFFATGTTRDTSLDWLKPRPIPQESSNPRGSSIEDLLAQGRELTAQTEAELGRTKLSNIRAEAVVRRQRINAAKARRLSAMYSGAVTAERELVAKGFMSAPVIIERPVRQGLRLDSRSAASER